MKKDQENLSIVETEDTKVSFYDKKTPPRRGFCYGSIKYRKLTFLGAKKSYKTCLPAGREAPNVLALAESDAYSPKFTLLRQLADAFQNFLTLMRRDLETRFAMFGLKCDIFGVSLIGICFFTWHRSACYNKLVKF